MTTLYTCKKHSDDYDFCPICEIESLNARIKDYQDACAQKQEIINGSTQDIDRLQARNDALVKALQDMTENDVVAYNGDEDECGHCAYCYELSFRPHAEDCPFLLARYCQHRLLRD